MATDRQLSEVLSEFARTLLTDFPIQAILDHLVERIVAIMPITSAGVTLISTGSKTPHYIAASSASALLFEHLQSSLAEGPCLAAFRGDQAVTIPDLRADHQFTTFGPRALASGLAAVFAFPLRHGSRESIGALDLYRDTPGPLDRRTMFAAQTLADVAASYILNAQARSDLRDASERFQQNSLHDALTGLPNRVLFRQLLDQAVKRAGRSGLRVAVLFADLDHFKDVNDLYGHQIGDELLRAVSGRLEGLLRTGDVLARLSGDEFVILCEGLKDGAEVRQLADRITKGMDTSFDVSNHAIHMTASIGIAYSGGGLDVSDRILRDADAAMYQAKRSGGDRNKVLDLREQALSESRMSLRHDLHGVLTRNELDTSFQPIVRTTDGVVTGFEALLRWTHPTRGVIPPSLIVPLAEQANMMHDIGRWVLGQACEHRARWQSVCPSGGLNMAVNVSPHQLLSGHYMPALADALNATDTDPALITVELTESVFIADSERALLVLNDLKRLGVQIALDDFGTGFSSLIYLQDFPVDIVKIDRSFVVKLDGAEAKRTIVTAIVGLAHELGMSVVAEGIETAQQHHELAALSCDYCQGFYFGRPLPPEGIDDLLASHSEAGRLRLPIS